MNNDTVYRHNDILQRLYAEIAATFDQAGGIAPSLHELQETKNWRYCKTQNKKMSARLVIVVPLVLLGLNPLLKL